MYNINVIPSSPESKADATVASGAATPGSSEVQGEGSGDVAAAAGGEEDGASSTASSGFGSLTKKRQPNGNEHESLVPYNPESKAYVALAGVACFSCIICRLQV